MPDGWRFLVALVDARTLRVNRPISLPLERAGASVRYSPDGGTVGVVIYGDGGDGGALWRYDANSGRSSGAPVPFDLQRRLTFNPFQAWPRTPVIATREGFVVGGLDNVSEHEGDVVRTFPKAGARALGIQPTAYAVSRDGRTVAIGGDDGSVHLLDLASGEVRTASGHHGGQVNEAIFTPDGRSLVTTGEDGAVIRWDVRQATQEETLEGHARSAFSPQLADHGRTLYTVDQGGTALIWDLAGDRRLGQAFATGKPDDPNQRYALSSDATLLAHGQSDGTVWIEDLRSRVPHGRSIPVVHETGVEGR